MSHERLKDLRKTSLLVDKFWVYHHELLLQKSNMVTEKIDNRLFF